MQAQRKIYLADNGLYNAVALKFSPDRGKLLENAVFQQLKRTGKEIYYFSEKKEVDFIVKEGLEVTAAINVCYDISDRETYLFTGTLRIARGPELFRTSGSPAHHRRSPAGRDYGPGIKNKNHALLSMGVGGF